MKDDFNTRPKRSEMPTMRWYIAVMVGLLMLVMGLSILAGGDVAATLLTGLFLGGILWLRIVMIDNMP